MFGFTYLDECGDEQLLKFNTREQCHQCAADFMAMGFDVMAFIEWF